MASLSENIYAAHRNGMMDRNEIVGFLEDVDHEVVLWKDSATYASSDWKPFKFLSIDNPIQRKLTSRECVFDFDGVTDLQAKLIVNYFNSVDLQCLIYRSSATGLHVHFWSDVVGKEAKKSLVKTLAKKIEDRFKMITNDIGPMNQGMIRSEFSIHPTKGSEKKLIHSTLNVIDPINIIPEEIKRQLSENYDAPIPGKSGDKHGKLTQCMRYILSHKFADGRARLLFTVVSWYVGSGLSKEQVFVKSKQWLQSQDYNVSEQKLRAYINSCNGTVGCRYRHDLLEELGVDITCDKKVKY